MNALNIQNLEQHSVNQPVWHLLDTLEPNRRDIIWDAIEELLATHPDVNIDHDRAWLLAKSRSVGHMFQTYVCLGNDNCLLGYAPFLVHPSSFSFSYSGYTLYDYAITRYSLTGQPLLVCPLAEAVDRIGALLVRLRVDLPPSAVVFGLGIPIDSSFVRAMLSPQVRAHFYVIPHGLQYQRRLLRIPAGIEEYMALLGPNTRQELRRQERRLSKETAGEVHVSVTTEVESVPAFLDVVEAISQKTYQSNLLSMGVHNNESTRTRLEAAAEHGWLRGYVLYCRGTPTAFMIGYLYRSVFYSETIGYDPAWAEWSVGNVLHLHVVRDLTKLGEQKASWFDFMYGDNSNKKRLSTDARAECNYYLVPRSIRWKPVLGALYVFEHILKTIKGGLNHYGLKEPLLRFLRQRSMR